MSTNSNERLWAALSHVLALVGWSVPFGQILAPLIIWLVKKAGSTFVSDHAKESLNFQLSLLIYGLGVGMVVFIALITPVLSSINLFFVVVVAWAAVIFVWFMVIVATIKAAKGKPYRYPMNLRLIK